MGRILRLTKKEFLAVMRDKRSRALLIMPPLIELLIFSFAATYDVRNVTLGVWDEDHGHASAELVHRLRGARDTFSSLVFLNGPREVREAIDSEQVLAVVHFGPDFTRKLEKGEGPGVQVLLDGRHAYSAMVVQGYLIEITQDFFGDWLHSHPPRVHGMVVSRSLMPAPPEARAWFNPNFDSIWTTVAALVALLTNLVVLLITSLSVAREREMGTFEQLLVSPLTSGEILLGKSIPAVVLGFGEGLFMATAAVLIFHLRLTPHGLGVLMAVMFAFVLATVGVGLFISALARTQQQAYVGAFTYMVPATLLCGFATPIETLPHWLEWGALINPLQYMVTLSKMVFMEDPPWSLALSMTWPLVPIAAVTLLASTVLFRVRME